MRVVVHQLEPVPACPDAALLAEIKRRAEEVAARILAQRGYDDLLQGAVEPIPLAEITTDVHLERVLQGVMTPELAARRMGATLAAALEKALDARYPDAGMAARRSTVRSVKRLLKDNPESLLRSNRERFQANLEAMRAFLPPEERAKLDLELTGRRFIDRVHYDEEVAKGAASPEHRYGQAGWQAWSAAERCVAENAAAGRPLTHDLVREFHRLGATSAAGVQGTAGQYKGVTNRPGGNWGLQGMFHALPQQQAEIVKQNPDLTVSEWGGDTPDFVYQQLGANPGTLRSVTIEYTRPEEVESKLQELFNWIESASQSGADPIAIAAAAQRRFISIHPFLDGNGRVSRLIMDYVLMRHGLPPALLSDPNLDWMVSESAWADEVRKGVLSHYEVARKSLAGYLREIGA